MALEVTTAADKTILAEMVDDGCEHGHIAEMVTDATRLDHWNPGWSARGAALAQATKDETPEFPVLRVEEGWSNNRRLWDGDELVSIAAQTNQLSPVGHLGHIPDDQAAYSMPEPQTTWFGATTKKESSQMKERVGEMVTVAYFAGYNLPGAKVRTLIPAQAVRGISWWGSGQQIPIPGKGVQVKGFVLKALDWARKGSEGMPSSRILATVNEMEGDKMAKELAQVTPEEFKSENPNGYQLLVTQATAEKDTKIGEMEQEIDTLKKRDSLLSKACELLGIEKPEEIETKITELTTRVGQRAKATLDAGLAKIIKEKIPGDDEDEAVKAKRALVLRVLPQAEMEAKLADTPDADAEKMIGEMVDAEFDKDDVLKGVVGEMQAPTIRRREELRTGDEKALAQAGVKRERQLL